MNSKHRNQFNNILKCMNKRLLSFLFLTMMCSACAGSTDKTLVSWVKLNKTSVKGGSILTIQDGEQFDGIILNEEGRWVPGSDELKRTEPTDAKVRTGKMEQIATVYKGSEIRTYRNGELVTKYTAKNIDLLSSDNNIVVFGRSHYGGEGAISCEIEDARIYRSALSVDQLKDLKPDKPSAITPYAWWDFEGDELIERTGRYTCHNIGEGENIELDDGKLILGRHGLLIATRKYVLQIPQWPQNPPKNWLTYHLAHPGPGKAEPGDPNPAFYYEGRYHLHYIYEDLYGINYAHVSSEDMVHWKWHPTVLTPPFTGHGMFSGTGFFTKQGQPVMIYHAVGAGKNALMYALDDNLDKWTKPDFIELTAEDGSEVDFDGYWDPDCWLNGETYYAISGGKNPPMMKSDDLKKWTFMGDLLHDDYKGEPGIPRNEDISCANMFKIGNKWMLLCISHRLGCRYFLGDFVHEKYLPDFHAMMNWTNTNWDRDHGGLVYFAPESMLTGDGRRVMWAWIIADKYPQTGIQSLPRELELSADSVLRIRPLRELESLRYGEMTKENITVRSNNDYHLNIAGDAVELKVIFNAPKAKSFGLKILRDDNSDKALQITAGADSKTISIGKLEVPFQLKDGEDLTLRVFIDKNLVEVFVNDRQAAAVSLDDIYSDTNISLFTNDAAVEVKEVKAWKMKSIY
jgi:sucrose-6-phosphate hydrolase SacC (GH32 family)